LKNIFSKQATLKEKEQTNYFCLIIFLLYLKFRTDMDPPN